MCDLVSSERLTQSSTGLNFGTPLEGHYQNWSVGEPNDNEGKEDCVHMYGDVRYLGDSSGKWSDCPCDWGVHPSVVCQKAI